MPWIQVAVGLDLLFAFSLLNFYIAYVDKYI